MQKKLMSVSIVALVLLLSFGALTPGCPVPEVETISPYTGYNNESVDVVITGEGFHKSAYVKLTKSGEDDIVATNLQVTKTEITCTLDLRDKAVGLWDLVVGNIGPMSKKDKPTLIGSGFYIEDANEASPVEAPEPEPEIVTEVTDEEPDAEPGDPNDDLKAIFFDFDKSNIRNDQLYNLDPNVKILKDNPGLKIVLCGHADERGTNEYNMELSSRRAESIKKYLVDKGIDASRIITYAYGEEYPAVTGQNESAWSFNRRVDISLWEYIPTKEQALK